jgi:C-terminal processing protease CtpA/Prc
MNERLAKLGELWSAIRYFHPFLAHRRIDWDAALATAVPHILAAGEGDAGEGGAGSYRDAIQSMLETLDDPVTRVLPAEMASRSAPTVLDADHNTSTEADSDRIAHWPTDGVLSLTLNATTLGRDFQKANEKVASVLPLLANARGVLLDLRSTQLFDWLDILFRDSRLEAGLVSSPLPSSGERRRMHRGLENDRSPYYYSGFQTLDGQIIAPADPGVDVPVIFLVNTMTKLPRIMVALQNAGRAAVVAEGPVTDESLVQTHTVSLGDGIRVLMRLGELVHPDGTTGFVPDALLPPASAGDTGDPAFRRALDLLRSLPAKRPPRPILPAVTAPPPESAYADTPYPSIGYRVLAAFRIWAAIHYFFPYLDLMEDDWDQVLRAYLPRFIEAEDALAYHLVVREMYTHIRDSHGYVRSETLASYFGAVPSALYARWVEDQPVVCGFRNEESARAAGVEIGDVIIEVDGEPAIDRIRRYARYAAASTPQRLMARATDDMLFGEDGSAARLTVRGKDGQVRTLEVPRRAAYPERTFPYRSGSVVRRLDENIGYIDLDRLERADADEALDRLMDADEIIFDMRGYPKPGAAWTIIRRLARDTEVPVALCEYCMRFGPTDEGRQRYSFVQKLEPRDPRGEAYKGRTVMLIDERTQSEAEHAGLFLQAANGTIFVGSDSSGADGDVTSFTAPGGISLLFSGQSVRYADGRQLQRVGLTPHVHARPTIDGIRAGRDEVLEAALKCLCG